MVSLQSQEVLKATDSSSIHGITLLINPNFLLKRYLPVVNFNECQLFCFCGQGRRWSLVPRHLCQTKSCWCSSLIGFKSKCLRFQSCCLFHWLFEMKWVFIGWSQLSCRKDTRGVFSEPVDPEEVRILMLKLLVMMLFLAGFTSTHFLVWCKYVGSASWLSWNHWEPDGFWNCEDETRSGSLLQLGTVWGSYFNFVLACFEFWVWHTDSLTRVAWMSPSSCLLSLPLFSISELDK